LGGKGVESGGEGGMGGGADMEVEPELGGGDQ